MRLLYFGAGGVICLRERSPPLRQAFVLFFLMPKPPFSNPIGFSWGTGRGAASEAGGDGELGMGSWGRAGPASGRSEAVRGENSCGARAVLLAEGTLWSSHCC